MTEINRDRLTGKTEVTPSSDEAIISNLKSMQRDFRGLANPEVILDGDLLTPYTGVQGPKDNEDVRSGFVGKKIVNIADLRPNDSAFAKHIWKNRPQNKKRVA